MRFWISMAAFSMVFLIGCQKSNQETAQKYTPRAAWKEIRPPEGGFSVKMPGDPTPSTSTSEIPDGPVTFHFFTLEYLDSWFSVQYADYPDKYVQQRSPQEMLDDAQGACIVGLQSKLISQQDISLNQYPGRDLTLQNTAGTLVIKARLFLVGNRIYQVTVRTIPKTENLKYVLEFLNSFKLLAE